jgi:hypothetical protein
MSSLGVLLLPEPPQAINLGVVKEEDGIWKVSGVL